MPSNASYIETDGRRQNTSAARKWPCYELRAC